MKIFEKLIIFYFTGTGNARCAAEWIIESAKKEGLETQLLNIAKYQDMTSLSITEQTLIGFCYPTHGFNAPPIFLRFLMQFPKSKFRNKVFVLNTRAGMKMSKLFTPGLSGLAQLLPAMILRVKSYQMVGYRPLDLPSNWISIHPGLKESVIHSIFARCKLITKNFAFQLLNGKKVHRGLYDIPIDLLISPVALGYYFYGRFILSKTFIATKSCDQCGLCEKNCPVNAIQMKNGRPYWSYNCESCMHCMNYCPKRAIETPHGFTALIWWLAMGILPIIVLYLVRKYELFGITAPSEGWNNIIDNFVSMVLGLALVFGAYRSLHFLLRFPFISRLVSATSLTSYKFWRRYRAPKT